MSIIIVLFLVRVLKFKVQIHGTRLNQIVQFKFSVRNLKSFEKMLTECFFCF